MKKELNTEYDEIDWDGVILDVNTRFDAIRQCWRESEKNAPKETHAKLVRDIYFPCLELLGHFVASVKLDGK